MKTKEILSHIWENRLAARRWSKREIKDWVTSNFSCSNYVANKAADAVYYNKQLYC
jgi:hypothetical protein